MSREATPRAIFVYGTLRPGEAGFDALDLAGRVDVLGPAAVAGTLYDLGEYPGAVLGGEGWIVGDLLMPRDDALFATLDEFELFDPAAPHKSEYLRVPARAKDRRNLWIYVYNFPLNTAPVIPSGDWRKRADRASDG